MWYKDFYKKISKKFQLFFRKFFFATSLKFERFLAPRSRFFEKVNGLGVLGEYLPMGGSNLMVEETLKLAYAVQALSGTGACRLFADFHKRFSPDSHIYIPVPTWSKDANVPQRTFHYYHLDIKGLDFASLMDDVKGSFFLLHACAHNPTGVDPTEEQWKEMSYQFKVKGHFAFFDMAYQGFASGDPEKDVKSIRIFLEDESLDWVFSVIC
ncbi:hypothetical protein LXL04_018410 [Taraxacum kok-saghyz]